MRALKPLYLFTNFIHFRLMIKTLFNRGQTHLAIIWVPEMPGQHWVSHERLHWPIFFKHSLKLPWTRVTNHYHKRLKYWSTHWKLSDFTYRECHYPDLSFPFSILMIRKENWPIYTDVSRIPARITDYSTF